MCMLVKGSALFWACKCVFVANLLLVPVESFGEFMSVFTLWGFLS